jgi:hypothetical protein
MTEISMIVGEYLRKAGIDLDGCFLAPATALVTQATMELEVAQQIGAVKHECTPVRQTQRNGYRERSWATRTGDIPLGIPKLRQGSYFPSLLEPHRWFPGRSSRAAGPGIRLGGAPPSRHPANPQLRDHVRCIANGFPAVGRQAHLEGRAARLGHALSEPADDVQPLPVDIHQPEHGQRKHAGPSDESGH